MERAELVAWLRLRLDEEPLPVLREKLIAEGHPAAAVDAAVHEIFSRDAEARRRRALRGGLIGAALGVAAWAAAFFLYRR